MLYGGRGESETQAEWIQGEVRVPRRVRRDPKVGVEMRLDLTSENVKALYDRYVG